MEKLHFLGQNREQNVHVQLEGSVGQQRWEERSLFFWNPHRNAYFHPEPFPASVLTQKCQPIVEADNPGVTNLVLFKNV